MLFYPDGPSQSGLPENGRPRVVISLCGFLYISGLYVSFWPQFFLGPSYIHKAGEVNKALVLTQLLAGLLAVFMFVFIHELWIGNIQPTQYCILIAKNSEMYLVSFCQQYMGSNFPAKSLVNCASASLDRFLPKLKTVQTMLRWTESCFLTSFLL